MLAQIRAMPNGIRLFLLYSLLLMAGVGLSLRFVVELAATMPISGEGVVVMALLAYTIFTTTLVLQRKQAARPLALGLATLTLPALLLVVLAGRWVEAIFLGALAVALFRGLTRPEVGAWLSEQ